MPLPAQAVPVLFGFFNMSPPELIIIGIVAVLLFGKRLPEVGRSLGKGMAEFKKGLNDVTNNMDMGSSNTTTSTHRGLLSYDNEVDDHVVATAPKFAPPPEEPSHADVPSHAEAPIASAATPHEGVATPSVH